MSWDGNTSATRIGKHRSMKFFTIAEVAECVGVSTRTVRRWIHENLLVIHRINGVVRISAAVSI
jgi:excisionase family DNA binding protein